MNQELSLTGDWMLQQTTIVAIAESGEVFSERGLKFRILEGRHFDLYPVKRERPTDPEMPMREVWSYRLEFYLADSKDPYESTQMPCHIALAGLLEDGRPCKIVGQGCAGRDDLNQIEGTFYVPPHIEIIGAEEAFIDSYRDESIASGA